MPSSLAHNSLEVHCSYRLKFFVAKNHLRSSSLSSCSLLDSRLLDHVQHALLKGLSTQGCGTTHAHIHCCPESKSKVRPKKKYARAGPAAAGSIFGQLTRAKMPYELWSVLQLLL